MTTTFTPTDTLRYADLESLSNVLNQQRARAFDVVADARALAVKPVYNAENVFQDMAFELKGLEPVLSEAGVTDVNGLYIPTSIADEGIAAKLDIPIGFLRKNRKVIPYLYQDIIQGWMERDERKFLLRLFRSDEGGTGVMRAFLSDQYKVIDNFDVLLAVLDGITKAGIENPVIDADLTDRRMVVRVTVPEMAVYAEKLLKNYRSPFDGTDVSRGWTPERLRAAAEREGAGTSDKVVFAGFCFSNSEIGGGAFRITPRIVVQACNNGLQFTADSIAKTHLGARLEEGVVRWSEATLKANLDLVMNQTRDAVETFLDTDYVTKKVEELEAKAGLKIKEPQTVISAVSRKLGFTEDQANLILSHFIKGGQLTAGGVTQAITSAAQEISDGEVAFEMEQLAVAALDAARDANKELARA